MYGSELEMQLPENILESVRNGDERAFEQLFRALYAPLCGYATKLLGTSNDAEEVVQAVFFKLWERRSDLNIETSFKAYIYRAVHNACLNQLKHEKVKQQYAAHVKATQVEGIADDVLEQKELEQEIGRAIAQLPEKCREVFELNRSEGLKYKEVAQLLNISEKTVENQMGKALKLLRGKLSKYLKIVLPWIFFFE